MWLLTIENHNAISITDQHPASLGKHFVRVLTLPCCALASFPCQDSKHTFPTHPWLSSEDGQAALKRVLSAYSVHNDKVSHAEG